MRSNTSALTRTYDFWVLGSVTFGGASPASSTAFDCSSVNWMLMAVLGKDYAMAILLSDTYGAQLDSAMKAGWEDPAMDEYNDYDAHRKP